MSNFEVIKDRYGKSLVHTDPKAFPKDIWVDTLTAIYYGSRTISQQREAISRGVIGVSGTFRNLRMVSDNKARARIHGSEARFRVNEGFPRLSFLKAMGISVGYQSATEESPRPAFAVVNAEGYHRVVRTSDEELDSVEVNLGIEVTKSLAIQLDGYYPSFDIFERLYDRNVTFED